MCIRDSPNPNPNHSRQTLKVRRVMSRLSHPNPNPSPGPHQSGIAPTFLAETPLTPNPNPNPTLCPVTLPGRRVLSMVAHPNPNPIISRNPNPCLLYTSDAADDLLCVDLGGRRIIKKQKNNSILDIIFI
eukprot:TRINITY_DN9644_c0_g1_i2.p1 TRINITY_DN9644_c0_g1~~TRINITY_DN9644_c0_g1_i2.p1  ORF type:complete len:130 (+),score=34.70 TRINITY_DN9644_c0_g1_i2:134-523(+)